MASSRTRRRSFATPLIIGLVVVLAAACAPQPTKPTGIVFNPPKVGYIGQQYEPKASAPNALPVEISVGEDSSGCTLADGVVFFESDGTCVLVASQTETEDTPALPSVQRSITVQACPTLRSGLWTGPQGSSADVWVAGTVFWGSVDLSAFGIGTHLFDGTISCDVVRMEFNGTALSGRLSPDGNRLSGSYSGISVTLNAPPA